METQPLLSNGQVIGYVAAIVGVLGSVVSFMFWRLYESMNARIADCNETANRRVGDAHAERDRAWQFLADFRRDFGIEAEKDRAVLERLRETIAATIDPPPRRSR